MAGSRLLPTSPLSHGGPETLLELLNAPQRVVPFELPEFDTVLLLTRLNIDWVLAGNAVDPELVRPANYVITREESVHVTFNDGRSIDGMIQMALPGVMNRASDFLNEGDDFFPLGTRLGTVIVNKARVRDTRVLAVSPRPEPVRAAPCLERVAAIAAEHAPWRLSGPFRTPAAGPSPQLRARAGER